MAALECAESLTTVGLGCGYIKFLSAIVLGKLDMTVGYVSGQGKDVDPCQTCRRTLCLVIMCNKKVNPFFHALLILVGWFSAQTHSTSPTLPGENINWVTRRFCYESCI